MAHTSEMVVVDGKQVKIATGTYGGDTAGKTQTINIYDHNNIGAQYQEVYRILDAKMYVSATDITANARNLHELDRYLIGRGATKEGPR